MKQKFRKSWVASKQPRKQRKYLANAPIHIKKKMFRVNLSKELRKRYGKRSLTLRKGDTVKIVRGKFKKKEGKVIMISQENFNIQVEGISRKKQDGSKVNIKLQPSNLQIISLNLEDAKRIKGLKKPEEENKSEKKTEKPRSKETGVKNAP